MSSVSSVSAAQASLVNQLKTAQTQPGQQGRGPQLDSVLQSLGVDSAKIPALEKQIQDAAESARKGGGQDRTAVKQAVDNVLKSNGVDPAKFEAAVKTHAGKGRKHHGHKGGGGSGVPAPSTPAQTSISPTSSTQVDVEG